MIWSCVVLGNKSNMVLGVEYINSYSTRLIIRDLMVQDSGMYTCYIGPLTNSVIITVQGRRHVAQ